MPSFFLIKFVPMIIRSKAPLRLGLAGGGTDVSPYADLHGGSILNATINMFAHTTIIPKDNGKIHFEAQDIDIHETHKTIEYIEPTGKLGTYFLKSLDNIFITTIDLLDIKDGTHSFCRECCNQ